MRWNTLGGVKGDKLITKLEIDMVTIGMVSVFESTVNPNSCMFSFHVYIYDNDHKHHYHHHHHLWIPGPPTVALSALVKLTRVTHCI